MLTQLGTMLRRIVGDHAHRTRHTNTYVFETFALPRPADLLSAAVATLQRSIAQRDALLDATDVALRLDWTHLEPIHDMIQRAQAASSVQRAETALSGEAPDQSPCYFVTCVNFAPTQYQHLDVIARSAMDTLCTDSLHTPCTSTQLMACPNVNIVASNTLRGVAFETTSNVDARP